MSYEATPVEYNPFGGEGEKPKALSPALEATPVEYDPFKEVSLSDSVGRGVDQMQGSFYGFAEATGELTGLDGVEAWGKEGRERNDKEAAAYGPAQQFTDIDSAGDAGQWVKEVFGSQLPMMAPALAGAAAGAAVGSVVPVLGTTVGGLIGAFIPSFMMNTGEIQGEIKERGGEAPGWAFAGGSAVAALDALLPVKFGSSLVKRFGKEAAEEIAETTLKKEVKSSAIKRAADGTISGIASEGITEAAQEAVGEFIAAHATNTPISDDLGKRILEAGAAGALMGGAIGSASGVMDTPSVVPTIEESSKFDPAPFHASEADVDDVAQQPFALEDRSTQALPEPPIYAQNETSEDVIYQGGATIPRLPYDHTVYEALPVGEVPLALPPSDVISGDGFTMGEQRIAPLDDAPNSSSVPMHNEQGERVGWFDMATGRAVADKGREAEVGVFEGQISRKIEPPYLQLDGPVVGDNFVMRDTDGVYSAPIGKPTVNDLEANLKDGRSQQEIDQDDLTNLRGLYSVAQRTRLAQSQRDHMRRLEKRLPDTVVQALRGEYSVNKPSDVGLGTEATNTSDRNLLDRYGVFQAFLSHRRKRGAAGKITPKMVMDQTGVAIDEARAMIARAKATGLLTAGGSQPTRKAPRDVFNIIREMGGMKLDGVYDGEIRQALSGRPGLISQRGIAADYVREHFEELGLLPVGSSTADMFNLIDQQANTKNKLFHPDDSDLVEAVEAQEIEAENARIKAEVTEQVQEWAEKLGERFTTDEIGSIVDDVLLNGKEIADAIVDEAENIAVRSEAFVSSYEPEYSIDIPFEGENNANQRTSGSAGRQNGEGIYGQEITSSSAQKSGEIAAPVAEDGGNFVEARRDYDGGPDDGNRTKARVPRTDTGPESSNHLNEKASGNGGFTVYDGSQSKPIAVSSKKDVERAASRSEGDTATPAQKEAENYRMGHIKLHGFDISIENGKGQKRTGHNPETGEQTWEVIMPAHYGRFKNTLGADGDHVDVYIGDNPKSEKVFVVDQVDAETGKFDEHKVMLGFDNLEQAIAIYDKGFSDGKGPQRRENVASLSVEDFRTWLSDGNTKKPFSKSVSKTFTVAIGKSDTVDKPLFQRGKNGQGKVRRGDAAIEDDYTIMYPHDEAKFAKIAERIRDEIRRLAPQANTVIANSILEKATGEDVWGLTQNHKAFGKVISVALYARQKDGSMQANPDVFGTIDHEVIHFLKGTGLFSESEWSVLSRAAQGWADKTKSDVGSRYSDHTQAQRNEEFVAHYFQEWASGKRHAGQTKFLDRLLTRLRNFFERLGNWLKGEGYQSLDDIFDRVSSGEVGKRATQKGGSSDSAPMYQRRTAPAHSFAQPNARIWEQLSDRNTVLIDRLKSTTSHLIEEGRRLFQDKFLPLKRAQEAIEKARGKVLLDSENAYQAEELYHGRTGRKLEEFQDQKVEPLLEDIKDANLTIEEVEEYLYARHAHERNSQIAKINKEMPDSGSGMSNQEAAKLLSKWKDDARFQDLQAIASRVDAIVRDTQKALLSGGLIDLETLQAWNETYQSYVPLKGLAEEDEYHFDGGGLSVGKGFDIRGQESKRAMGRGHENRATDILANILTAYEEVVVRSEKNKVGQTFLNFALKNPDKTLWEVDKVEYEPKVSKASGMVYFGPKPGYQLADNVLAVKVDGEVHHITIHHEGIAKAMKNIGADTGNAFLRSLQSVNRFLAAINTSYNPEFIISNFSRDIQTAAINLQGFDVDGLTKKTMKNAWKAMKGIYAMERGNGAGDRWARHAEQFAKDGGQTKFFGLEDIEAKRAKLDRLMKDLDPSKPRKMFIALRSAEQWISDVNTSVENGVRLSAYVHLIDAGVTREKAASIAKNLTVNFNRKGEYGSTLGAFYLFYNASIQGSVRLAQALKHSKRVRKTVVGLIGANVALELFNGFFSPEDEDGEKVYDKQTKFTMQHNIVFVNPWASATDDPLSVNAVTIPMPYGYNVFANIGRAIGEGVRFAAGNKADFKPLETSADLVALMFESFNPIGGESDLTRTFMPTLAKPTFELATNENFMGSPIMPEDRFGKETPDSEKSFKSVHPWLKGLASALNDLTGGNEVRPGLLDVSSETMEHMIEFVTGGTGKTVTRLTKLIHNGVTGEDIRTDDIPFVRKFLEGDSQYYRRYKFYDLRNAVQLLEREVKMLREAGRGDAAKRAIDENRVEWRLRNFIKRTDRVLKPMRKRLNALNADERLNDTVKKTRIKAIEQRMEREYERAIRQYIKLLESSRNPH